MGNVIQEVVYHNSKLISGDPIGSENNKVADIRFKILSDVPRNSIDHRHFGVTGEQPDRCLLVTRSLPVTAGAGIHQTLDSLASGFPDLPS